MGERIRGWFSIRRKVKALEMIKVHAATANDVVKDLGFCIQASLMGNEQDVKVRFEELEQREREADSLRRKISEELAKGELEPAERNYAMRLTRQIDLVADFAHGAGRTLSFLSLANLPDDIRMKIESMGSMTKQCAEGVRNCIVDLVDGDMEGTLKNIEVVEQTETEVDQYYTGVKGLLLKLNAPLENPWQAIFLIDLLDSIEETTDRCEDACDQVRLIVVSAMQK